MSRIGLSTLIFALAPIALGASTTRSDDAPKPDPQVPAIDRILTEWHKHSSQLTSLQVAFQSTDTAPGFGKSEAVGTAYLAKPNLALVDIQSSPQQPQEMSESHRYVWTSRSFYWFIGSTRTVTKGDFAVESSRPPKFLSLYFLFGMTVEEAKSEHDWEVIREDDSEVTLRALDKNRGKKNRFIFYGNTGVESFFVTLDKKNYRTKMVAVPSGNSLDYRRDGTVYLVKDLQINPILDLETMKNPSIADFKLIDNSPRGLAPKILKPAEQALDQKK